MKTKKEFEFVKDYPRSGKKAGEKILLYSVPPQLYDYIKEVNSGEMVPEPQKKAKVKRASKKK